jgi:hypothetical protein
MIAEIKNRNAWYPQAAVSDASARALETSANIDPVVDFWPDSTGTRVHLLIEQLSAAGFGF